MPGIFARIPWVRSLALALITGFCAGSGLPTSATAETYVLTESYGMQAVIRQSRVMGAWPQARSVPSHSNDPYTPDIQAGPDWISLNGSRYERSWMNLQEVNVLIDYINSSDGSTDGTRFPVEQGRTGPLALAMAAQTPDFLQRKVFIGPEEDTDGIHMIIPMQGGFLRIVYEPVWIDAGNTAGGLFVGTYVFRPTGQGIDFDTATRTPDDPEDTDADRTELLTKWIKESDNDLAKIIGCAAALYECPQGQTSDDVLDWLGLARDPVETLRNMMGK